MIVREGVNEQGEKLRFYLNYSWEEQRVEVADDFEVVLGMVIVRSMKFTCRHGMYVL